MIEITVGGATVFTLYVLLVTPIHYMAPLYCAGYSTTWTWRSGM